MYDMAMVVENSHFLCYDGIMAQIDEHTLEHLYKLSRIDAGTDSAREKKILKDLSQILNHFNELQEVDTDAVEPLAGGTDVHDVYHADEPVYDADVHEREREHMLSQFPERERGYLKVPPIF